MWIKDVIVDVLATVVIVLAATLDLAWARWIVWLYTPLMLLLKLGAFFGGSVVRHAARAEHAPPEAFYHLLYAVNVTVLLAYGWWLVGTAWATIWGLSTAAARRAR